MSDLTDERVEAVAAAMADVYGAPSETMLLTRMARAAVAALAAEHLHDHRFAIDWDDETEPVA